MIRSALRTTGARGGEVAVAVLILGAGLAGCTASVAPHGSATPVSSGSATSHPVTPATPAFVPDGTASQNLPLFSEITARVWASPQKASGRAYIDALVAAGFDKKRMQVTRDTSTVGNPAESIQFSVLWKDGDCLVGQVGPATGAPVTVVLPGLSGGVCLLGDTRPIDW